MPQKVDPIHNVDDQEALYAGAMGRSNKFILGNTALSDGQIAYRLKKEGIKRMDARNGDTPFSEMMYRMGRHVFLTTVLARIRRKYQEQPTKKRKAPFRHKKRRRVAK